MDDKHKEEKLLDHDADGIQEFDNPLPSWWMWMFVISVAFGAFYLIGDGFNGTTTAQRADKIIEELRKPKDAAQTAGSKENIFSKDPMILALGAEIFKGKCASCHGQKGEGLIGPNFTDKYWIHGNQFTDLYNVVVNGVTEKGMQAWKDLLTDDEIRAAISYVHSLQGTNPPNQKEPQGEFNGMISNEDNAKERLSTTSESGARIYLYPSDVKGSFRFLRNRVYDILLIIFLALPWIRIHGDPLLLLDIPSRKFYIFGLTFWGHDAPILFFVLLTFLAAILLVTAVLGRFWCGWGCPQTVFIDRVFRRIDTLVEGSAARRRKLAQGPWNFNRWSKFFIKWLLFLIASLIITHSFLAYFVGTDALMDMITRPPSENPKSFAVIVFTTALILFDFGWFREQFCIIACPYGRLQSVLDG